jgi:hypothetical protein
LPENKVPGDLAAQPIFFFLSYRSVPIHRGPGACPGPVPGPPASANKGKEGREGKEGRKGRKEEGKERVSGAERSVSVVLMMDGSMDTEECKTSSRGREGWGEEKMRRGKGTKESYGQ